MEKEYLIIGGGLAGLFFAHCLHQENKTFTVIDNANPNAASMIAAGMFGPLGGQLSKLAWKAPEMIDELFATAKSLEHLLGKTFLHQMPVEVAFGSIKDANDYASRNTNEQLNRFLSDIGKGSANILAPFGSFEMRESGWFDTKLFVETYRNYLKQQQQYQQEHLLYSDLVQTENGWTYQEKLYKKVVFAEGYHAQQNPFIQHLLPFKLCKGQVLEISCSELDEDRIIKKGIYLVPQASGMFKAGATYEWDKIDEHPTEAGKAQMEEKIKLLMPHHFSITKHWAGIRPTTNDRNPIIGKVPHVADAFILNGLGTKGVVRGPWLAKTLFNFIEKEGSIPREVSVERVKPKTS